MIIRRFLALVMAACFLSNPATSRHTVLGVVVAAKLVHLNSVAVTTGAAVYDGDSFSTEGGGLLLLRSRAATIELVEESEVLLRSRANGAQGIEAVLSKGTLAFSTERSYTIELVMLGARICPVGDARTVAQVSVMGPKELRINVRRGSLQFSYRGEMETIAEGKSYRVILDPPEDSPKQKGPLAPGKWPKGFKIVIIGEAAAVVALGIYELRESESPDRP